MNNGDNLLLKYNPYLFFHKKEKYFPMDIDDYCSLCELRKGENLQNSIVIERVVNKQILGKYIRSEDKDVFLHFVHELSDIRNEKSKSYGKHIELAPNKYALIYFYIYNRTLPYKCCNCLCDLTSFAHLGDIKAVIVYVTNGELTGMYYCAHGHFQGQYVNKEDIVTINSHPVVFPCLNDHSNYNDSGCHPRIFGIVNDQCNMDISVIPELEIVNNSTNWCYYKGAMNIQGINGPVNHDWWDNDVPINDSNNWWRRLFCFKYW